MKQDAAKRIEVHESHTEPSPFTEKGFVLAKETKCCQISIKTVKTVHEACAMFTSLLGAAHLHGSVANYLCLKVQYQSKQYNYSISITKQQLHLQVHAGIYRRSLPHTHRNKATGLLRIKLCGFLSPLRPNCNAHSLPNLKDRLTFFQISNMLFQVEIWPDVPPNCLFSCQTIRNSLK